MPECATRMIEGLLFDCPSPSVLHLVGEPVTLAYDGQMWVLTLIDRNNKRREGYYMTRSEAIANIVVAYRPK